MHSWLPRAVALPQRMFSWAVASVVLCAVYGMMALAVYHTERENRQHLTEQFRLRADIAETFLRAYVKELLARERSIAELQLSEPVIAETDFQSVARTWGYKGAVILDGSGKLEHVFPAMPHLRGTSLTERYAHLRDALTHGAAVSGVVQSAALGTPVVAFATRYDSDRGPRVFSGAFDVRATPLTAYMENLLELEGAHADLMDQNGLIIASSRALTPLVNALDSVDPALAQALQLGSDNEFDSVRVRKQFFERSVTGTPWRLIISVDYNVLFASLGGQRRLLQWALFGGFCMVSFIAAVLLVRLRSVSRLHARLARLDRLTELPNRLHLEEHMARMISSAERHGRPFSVFIVDVDHFKAVNDNYGHKVGDEVLRALASRMTKALRAEDMLGRWGGEEFLALLPNTNAEGACIVANRVRTMAGSSPIITPSGEVLQVTVSIGCSTKVGVHDTELLQRADEALYSAKELGRNRVVSSSPPSPRHESEPQPLAQST
jgi:diguanylate cyclase (GGDEF)-like protein